MRTVLLIALFAAACTKASSTPAEQGDKRPRPAPPAKNVTIKTTKAAGSVWMLQGRGGNIGIQAGDDGVVMIDDEFAPLAPKILAAIRKLGKGNPTFLINTHWHGDHTGGNAEMGRFARIIAQENVRKRLTWEVPTPGRKRKPMPAAGLPVITFPDTVTVHFNGEAIRVVHFPHGHTDGDSVVFFKKSNVVHTGDDFFNGRFPFIDVNSGGNVVQYEKNVAKILTMIDDQTKIIPGHGPLGTKADLQRFHDMLVATMDIVRKAKKAGKTLAQLQKVGLPARYKSWGTGFVSTDRWLGFLYNGLP